MPKIMFQEEKKNFFGLLFSEVDTLVFLNMTEYFDFSSSQISVICQKLLTSAIQGYHPPLLVPLDAAHLITWIFMG